MNKLLLASGLALFSLYATSAEAACRQVPGGMSCNGMGMCWHNPPKTVCDAPPARIIAPPPQNRINMQPNVSAGGLIAGAGGNMRR